MQKKSIILLITLFFIITISTIILKNIEDTEKFLDNIARDDSLSQMQITINNIKDEVSKFLRKNKNDIDDILQHSSFVPFKIKNIDIVCADFPDGVKWLPEPDRVFIGGGGEKLPEIIDTAVEKLCGGGVIVITMVLLQNIDTCLNLLRDKGCSVDLVHVQVSRMKSMPFGNRLTPLNPVWIISGVEK